MKIIQLLTTISYGDAVSNDTLALCDVLQAQGYETYIYAENIDSRIKDSKVRSIKKMPKFKEQDIIIYHLSTGTDLNYKLAELKGRKIIIYHNVTPSKYFEGYNRNAAKLCKKGRDGLKFLADKVDYGIADSGYNKKEMLEAGYQCKVDVLPILIPFADYDKTPDESVIHRFQSDEYTNILFTGRISPNKKQEDVIRAFYMYQKYYNPKSRLFLVGSYRGMESYYYKLKAYAKELELENVFFTGHIKFSEILAYYKIADLFLCMSEHEGFCVPLVEAMKFEVPIVAYDSSAIGDTLCGAGILLKEKNPLEVAGVIDYLVKNQELKEAVVERQKERMNDFAHEKVEEMFLNYLSEFMRESK